jgi:Ribbon-helix-helix protein, copG family
MRQRHALYLSEAMTKKLQATAETHRVSKSTILERALQQYLTPDTSGPTSTNLQYLQHESRQRSLRRIERDLAIATELTATFVRYFLMITPPLPSSEHEAARALGELRFDQVIEEITKRIRTDRSLIATIMATMTKDETTSGNPGSDDHHAIPPSQPIARDPNPGRTDG